MQAFSFEQEIVLENDKVRLRPLRKTDFDTLVNFAIHEPTLWQYSLMQANSKQHMQQYLDHAITRRIEKKAYPFIVFDKLKKQYAGSTRFYDYQKTHKTVNLGYTWYGKDFQGTYVNKNCKFLLLDYAFDVLEIERVEFRADYKNSRSISAMKSIGCTVEGVLGKNCASPDGTRRDSIILSTLRSEWFETKKKKLQQLI